MFTFPVGLFGADPLDPITIVIEENQLNFNLWDAVGRRRDAIDLTCIINAGVLITSNDVALPAFTIGGFTNPRTKIQLINFGKIHGQGGDGGKGADYKPSQGIFNGEPGKQGGTALVITFPVTIDNTAAGQIFGGGGGGGGAAANGYESVIGSGGGGGGGGLGGKGGLRGTTDTSAPNNAQNGENGNATTGGAGGTTNSPGSYYSAGGNGGNVGFPGTVGATADFGTGGPGGSVGISIKTNGNTITWISGNNSTQVKGAIS